MKKLILFVSVLFVAVTVNASPMMPLEDIEIYGISSPGGSEYVSKFQYTTLKDHWGVINVCMESAGVSKRPTVTFTTPAKVKLKGILTGESDVWTGGILTGNKFCYKSPKAAGKYTTINVTAYGVAGGVAYDRLLTL